MNTRPFDIRGALEFGLDALRKNFFLILGVVAAGNLMIFLAASIPFLGLIIALACVAFQFMTLSRIGLDFYDGKAVDLARIRQLIPLMGKYIAANFLVYSLTILTMLFIILRVYIWAGSCWLERAIVLLVLANLVWLVIYGFADLVVVDTGMGPVDALKRSNQITYGHKWYLSGIYLLAFVIGGICSIIFAVPVIGFIVACVLSYTVIFFRVYIYRKLVEAKKPDDEQYVAVPPIF